MAQQADITLATERLAEQAAADEAVKLFVHWAGVGAQERSKAWRGGLRGRIRRGICFSGR